MRGALPTGLLLVFLSSLHAGCWEEPPAPTTPAHHAQAERPGGVPGWVPAPTRRSRPRCSRPWSAPSRPRRGARLPGPGSASGYANNRPLADVEDAAKFTRLVNKVLNDSPQFYALDDLPPGAANPVVQYGPGPAEADGYKVARRHDEGLEVVAAAGAEEARAAVTAGAEMLQGGNVEGAIDAYRAALARAPGCRRCGWRSALPSPGRGVPPTPRSPTGRPWRSIPPSLPRTSRSPSWPTSAAIDPVPAARSSRRSPTTRPRRGAWRCCTRWRAARPAGARRGATAAGTIRPQLAAPAGAPAPPAPARPRRSVRDLPRRGRGRRHPRRHREGRGRAELRRLPRRDALRAHGPRADLPAAARDAVLPERRRGGDLPRSRPGGLPGRARARRTTPTWSSSSASPARTGSPAT